MEAFKAFLRTHRGRSIAWFIVGIISMTASILLYATMFGGEDADANTTKTITTVSADSLQGALTITDCTESRINWVQACAYKQAKFIDRLDGLLSCLILFGVFCVFALLFYAILDFIVDFKGHREIR